MAHVIETRSIGNHADMGPRQPGPARVTRVTVLDIVRAGKRRRAARLDQDYEISRWRSEGGAGSGT